MPNDTRNPFAVLVSPETVLAAIETSPTLSRLKRVTHELDAPAIRRRHSVAATADLAAFDNAVDAAWDSNKTAKKREIDFRWPLGTT